MRLNFTVAPVTQKDGAASSVANCAPVNSNPHTCHMKPNARKEIIGLLLLALLSYPVLRATLRPMARDDAPKLRAQWSPHNQDPSNPWMTPSCRALLEGAIEMVGGAYSNRARVWHGRLNFTLCEVGKKVLRHRISGVRTKADSFTHHYMQNS